MPFRIRPEIVSMQILRLTRRGGIQMLKFPQSTYFDKLRLYHLTDSFNIHRINLYRRQMLSIEKNQIIPQFSILKGIPEEQIWPVYLRTLQEYMHPINTLEGWHRYHCRSLDARIRLNNGEEGSFLHELFLLHSRISARW